MMMGPWSPRTASKQRPSRRFRCEVETAGAKARPFVKTSTAHRGLLERHEAIHVGVRGAKVVGEPVDHLGAPVLSH